MKTMVMLYLTFLVVGGGLEWCYGKLWDVVGVTPWTYPNSPLRYTSLEMLPLWGFGGLIWMYVYRGITQRSAKLLAGTIVPLILGALWIIIWSWLS